MRTIIVAGYGWTGSSALVDYFKEFEKIVEPNVEFRIIKDPYGLFDLEKNLLTDWEVINSSNAIQDFLTLCEKCNRKTSVFNGYGLNYKNKLNSRFMEITHEYISSLSNFTYDGVNFCMKFKQNAFEYTVNRIINKLPFGNRKVTDTGKLFFSKPNYIDFICSTQDYIERIFEDYSDDKIILLDQAVSPINLDQLKYFRDVKMIIVDRNPYDIYADMIENKSLLGKDLCHSHDTQKYCQYHKGVRNKVYSKDVLYITFENLVNDYVNQKEKILDFIGWDLGVQKEFSLFRPEESRANISYGEDRISPKEIREIKQILGL